jgi:hypothetical protein
MIMPPALRKLALLVHIVCSVGWMGADGGFLALAIVGLTSQDAQLVRAAYLAMRVLAWWAIVPLCLAALISGLVQEFGTKWGLFRYYWVLVKFLIAIGASAVLLIHTQPIELLANSAAAATLSSADLRGARLQIAVASGAGLLVLLVEMALAVYKPRGMTRYGWRKQREQRHMAQQ